MGSLEPWIENAPPDYKPAFEKANNDYGDPASLLSDTYAMMQTAEEKEAFYFLASNITPGDRVRMTPQEFATQIKVAVDARNKFPWCRELSKEMFQHYVLPYRATQEPFEDFRGEYSRELFKLLENTNDSEEAVYLVNEWVASKMTYKPTERYDQGPLSTIKRGYGRCEEETILFIAAARTVGIPTRQCYTPYWTFTDSNHSWVQVYVKGRWYDLGPGELTSLNKAWFSESRKRAAVLVTPVFGKYKEMENEKVIEKGLTYSILASPDYKQPLKIKILDEKGKAATGFKISINVYNFANIRLLYSQKTDANGEAQFYVNQGDYYLLIWDDKMPNLYDWKKISQPSRENPIVIKYKPKPLRDEGWLRVIRVKPEKTSPDNRYTQGDIKNIENKRKLKEQDWQSYRTTLGKEFTEKTKTYDLLKDCGGNLPLLLEMYRTLSPEQREEFKKIINIMADKDIATIQPDELKEHIILSMKYTRSYHDSIYTNYILQPRIYLESSLRWRKKCLDAQQSLKSNTIAERVKEINEWINSNCKEIDPDYIFGDFPNAGDMTLLKCGSKKQLAVLAVGMLRSAGIPARLSENKQWAEYYHNNTFNPLYPKNPELLGKKEDKQENIYKPKAALHIEFRQKEEKLGKSHRYYYDFTISHFEKGNFEEAEPDTFDGGIYNFNLSPSEHVLVYGQRNVHGDAYIRAIPFKYNPSSKNKMNIDITLPDKAISKDDFCLKSMEDFSWHKSSQIPDIIKGEWKKKGLLLVFIRKDNEASTSAINSLRKTLQVLHEKGIVIKMITKSSDADHFKKLLGEMANKIMWVGENERLNKDFLISSYPTYIYFTKQGELNLYASGFSLSIGSIIEKIVLQSK